MMFTIRKSFLRNNIFLNMRGSLKRACVARLHGYISLQYTCLTEKPTKLNNSHHLWLKLQRSFHCQKLRKVKFGIGKSCTFNNERLFLNV